MLHKLFVARFAFLPLHPSNSRYANKYPEMRCESSPRYYHNSGTAHLRQQYSPVQLGFQIALESPVTSYVGNWDKLGLYFLPHPDKQEVHVGQGRYLGLNLAPGGTDEAITEHEHRAATAVTSPCAVRRSSAPSECPSTRASWNKRGGRQSED